MISFRPLDEKTIAHVVDKFLMGVDLQLEDKNVRLETDDAARAWLAEHGYDRALGARPMERLIQDRIKKALAEELLFGKLAHGGHVKIGVADDDLHFEITASQAPDHG